MVVDKLDMVVRDVFGDIKGLLLLERVQTEELLQLFCSRRARRADQSVERRWTKKEAVGDSRPSGRPFA